MILIDSSAGSKELVNYTPLNDPKLACLVNLSSSSTSSVGSKSSADVSFVGNGPDGQEVIGIEFKSLSDLLSSIHSGKLQDTQLPELRREYDRPYLLYYGEYRCSEDGYLETPFYPIVTEDRKDNSKKKDHYWYVKGIPYQGPFESRSLAIESYNLNSRRWNAYNFIGEKPMKWGYLQSQLASVQHYGIQVVHFNLIQDCAQWIACQYRWWSKPYDKHSSFKQFDRSSDLSKPAIMPGVDPVIRSIMEFADRIPGIDYKRSYEVARHFGSVRRMVNADLKEWLAIPGIGKVIAKTAIDYFEREARDNKQASEQASQHLTHLTRSTRSAQSVRTRTDPFD